MLAPKRRRRLWLALAVLLLCAGALVLSFGEREPVSTRAPRMGFPDRMRPAEHERRKARATLLVPAPPPGQGEEPGAPYRRDPFLVSLPVKPDQPVVVLEANALRHSRLGERFVACLLARDPDTFARIEREAGVDPLKDVDRVAFVGDALVVSGFFDRMKRDRLEQVATGAGYGENGRIYTRRDGRQDGTAVATWGDGIVLFGSPASLQQSIDQLEGRVPVPPTGIPDDMAYGEAYGVIPGAAVQRILGRQDADLARRIAQAASRVELHVDAMEDVAAVARVQGDDEGRMRDLARSIGAAMAVARLEAQANDDRKAADLLEHARVLDRDGSFSVELALPADRLEALFEGCERSTARAPRSDRTDRAVDGSTPDSH
jgi:hypothetical protein